MVPVLLVAHAGLGALAIAASFLPPKWERRALVTLCLLGAGTGVAVAVLGVLGETWRSLELGDTAVITGAASSVAWLVTSVTAAPRGRAVACSLVGIGCTALIISASALWLVPMLLFWVCSSLAIAVLAGVGKGGTTAWSALFLSDALLVGGLLVHWLDERTWTMPTELDGWSLYLVLGAAAVRGGALPVIGVWGAMRGTSAPVAPLLAGGSFVLATIALGPGDPWAGAAFFAIAIGSAAWGLWGGKSMLPASGAAAMSLLLGAAIVAPPGLVAGALAAVLAAGAIDLWGRAGALGGAEKSLALTALPPWIGFIAIATAMGAAVDGLATAQDVVDKVPWTFVVVLLPGALAAGTVVAARSVLTLHRAEPWWPALKEFRTDAFALLLSRALVVAGLAGGMVPGEWLGIDAGYAEWAPRRTILFGAALALGVASAVLFGKKMSTSPAHYPLEPAWITFEPQSGSIAARALAGVSLVLAVASIATVAWFTFEGLRLGFL